MKWVGWGAVALLLCLTFGALGALLSRADWPLRLGPGDAAAIRFTLLQSLISASLSLLAAVPLARALARRSFPGRGALLLLLGAPFILPVIVAVFGLIAIWGRSGLVSAGLTAAGLPPLNIYGLPGVVLAHVFFNLPLATRLILQGWARIPAEHFRLAAQLGFDREDLRRQLEWPMLKAILPGAFMLIFLLSMTSFATVLTLGGGPKATSVELAIYSALRFDFDLGRAAILGLVQMLLSAGVAALLLGLGRPADLGRGLAQVHKQWIDAPRATDAAIIALGSLFLIAPLAAVALRGIWGLGALGGTALGPAIATSLAIAILSTCLAVGGALGVAMIAASARMGWLVETVAALVFVVSPFVLGTGLFIALNPIVDPFALAVPVTAIVNAALCLPFCVRILVPAVQRVERDYARLGASLGLVGGIYLRRILWPGIRSALGFAAGLSFAFSMGDLGVITLFAPVDGATLPLVMYRLMGSYQMDAAAGAGLLLVGLAFGAFAVFDRGGRLGRQL